MFVIVGLPIQISDRPAYPWRGLMLDTANHFIPVASILRQVDALAMNKMNVLHWHIVDSYSFPFVSEAVPELSQKGSWAPDAVYTPADVAKVLSYASARGVRVVPELDAPGHGYAFGLAFPEMVIPCTNVAVESDIGPVTTLSSRPPISFFCFWGGVVLFGFGPAHTPPPLTKYLSISRRRRASCMLTCVRSIP